MANKIKIYVFVLYFALFISYCSSEDNMTEPLVTVTQGQLQGAVLELPDGSQYYSFKGVPYGHVPKRFSAPIPAQPWDDIYDATKHGPICPQYNNIATIITNALEDADENCLFLNVYTRSLNPDAKTPVMVYIHGGSYMTGSGNTDNGLGPESLLQHDVILVTINYRLDVLGFLCLDTPEVPGNAGMRDQIEALKWVKGNIAQFGGDPDSVTIFGESAGSASVSFHMQSPMSKGLFSKAILQSGVNIDDWALGKNGKEIAFRVAKYLGFNSTDTTELLEFLRSVPTSDLLELTYKSMTEDTNNRDVQRLRFAPIIEKEFDNVEAFITEDPVDSLVSNKMRKIPIMIGYTSDEALLVMPLIKDMKALNKNPENIIVPRQLATKVTEVKAKEFSARIKNYYVGDDEFTEDNLWSCINLLSDIKFVYGIQRFANFYSKYSLTYMYRFSCDTELNWMKKALGLGHVKGACHVDDLFYLFYTPSWHGPAYAKDPTLKDLVFRVTKLWTNFAKTGNPTPDNSLGVTWQPYTPSKQLYLDIDVEMKWGLNMEKGRVDFWCSLYHEAGLPCNITS